MKYRPWPSRTEKNDPDIGRIAHDRAIMLPPTGGPPPGGPTATPHRTLSELPVSARRPACYFPRRDFFAVALLLPLVTAIGCGDGKIKTYPVTGTVTVGGKPYPGARLMFVPQSGSEKFQKERPTATTEESGRFELTTFLKGDGAPAGDYKVMIRSAKPSSREQAAEWKKRPKLNPKYRKPSSSDVVAIVLEEPTELPPFEL